ncbi:MAG: calcium/sodium antiporter [Pseudomonadota bacterium]
MVGLVAGVLVGLTLLLVAGDMLVRGAVGLATALKIPPLLVGLTIVAFGTSAPELVVSIQSVLNGNPGIAIGNIIGSNIANILLVLGLPAIVYPIATHVTGLRRHVVIMLVATTVFMAFAYVNGAIDRTAGVSLFAGILAFITYMAFRAAAAQGDDPVLDDVAEYTEGVDGFSMKLTAFLIAGLIGLPFGAHLLVENGAQLASMLGVRDEVIGLTIVAFGTSLPELATVIAAALQKKSDVAIGNIIGSNIFNILAVGGVTGLVGTAPFDQASLQLDIPVMAAASVIVAFFVFTRRDIGRIPGALMFAGYLAFVALLASKAL